jgi:lipopolysaccharide/colanic/teichoic acid biosynthesis glycosyltransferase
MPTAWSRLCGKRSLEVLKRLFDFVVSGIGLAVAGPLLLVVAALIKSDSPGPVFYRQTRVGKDGKSFRIHKFRTMVVDADTQGPRLTSGNDRRITRIGLFLRRWKIDELPQLIDVFLGDMSLVGPRPEVPEYVSHYPEKARRLVLSVRPGITDWASIHFRDENNLLVGKDDATKFYIEQILPIKLQHHEHYAQSNSFAGDLRIIVETVRAVLFR